MTVLAARSRPWRKVVGGYGADGQPTERPVLRHGRGGVLGPDTSRRARWWVLRLACDHRVERFVRYLPRTDGYPRYRGGHQSRSESDVADPPKRVRCEFCPPTWASA